MVRSLTLAFTSVTDEDKYVVFVSGLSIGSEKFNPLQFQLLIDHITGHLGDENVCAFLFYFSQNEGFQVKICTKFR